MTTRPRIELIRQAPLELTLVAAALLAAAAESQGAGGLSYVVGDVTRLPSSPQTAAAPPSAEVLPHRRGVCQLNGGRDVGTT